MKPGQRQHYAACIDRVVGHLELGTSDDSAPSLAELASVAGMSEFHFHRVFRLMTGETVGEAIRRLRLARTLPDLAEEPTVARAVGSSGYATPQGFARAMKAQTGMTPSAARADGATLDLLASCLRAPKPIDGTPPALAIEVVSVEPFRLLAIRNIGDYAELNWGYRRLFDLVLEQMPPDALLGIYGVPYDDPRFTPAEACRFDCALAVGEAGLSRGELAELELGGGSYVRLRHLGDYDQMPDAIDLAYAAAIALLDRGIGDSPLFVHYLDDPEEVAEADLRSDLYLPLA